ncbi:GLABROUS1 enhancer-binding protein-like 3 isoform X2 [Arabidopsis lyrata subsp. lyrata]|uniref:GLABROUS1 enhancer-binding protein-like 3 isoform X2 n=1 Tax=Arabidopsis lyrata subsp. lyrata TaxID=81972 RepID=UPI000A29B7B0|nr:GLABROUS1 enhancer-binding protein-like 3 isoform X2 [Arabidopsis lyrata subsp. lyrata]|eukprot:XP_020873197.1 GLABROUS1 enhancer-binding protein-like 3 isoform X2 [Arabidopsis lyrata subsp. lyrata]
MKVMISATTQTRNIALKSDPESRPMLSSPLKRKHDDDYEISGLRRRKLPKTRGTFVPSSSASLKMTWSKEDEISILSGILDYQEESQSSYNQKYDAFYDYMREYMESDFSKKQLMDKVKKLKKRFRENQARSRRGLERIKRDLMREKNFLFLIPKKKKCSNCQRSYGLKKKQNMLMRRIRTKQSVLC